MINKFLDKLYTQGLILDEKQKEIDRLRKKNSFTINVSQFNHKYTDKDILSSDNQTFSLYNDNVLDRNMETLNNLVSLQNEAETFNIKENNMRWNGLNELGNENSGETSYKKEEVNDEDYTGINIRGSREFPIEGNAPLVQPLKKKNLKAKPEVGESTKILMGIFNKNTKRKGSSSAKNKLFCPKKKNDSKTHLTPTSPSGIIEIGYSNKFLCRNYQILTQYYKQLENSTQDVHSSNIREIKTNRGECKKINECYYIPKGTLRSSKSDNDIKENSS